MTDEANQGSGVDWDLENDALRRENDALTAERDRLIEELSAVSAAIGSVEFMDPPDGGDVSLGEQVGRMRSALTDTRRQLREAREALQSIPGLAPGSAITDPQALRCYLAMTSDGRILKAEPVSGDVYVKDSVTGAEGWRSQESA